MKFITKIKEQIIPEWIDFYINYKLLVTLLSPLKAYYKSGFESSHLIPRKNSHFSLISTEINDLHESLIPEKEDEDFCFDVFNEQFQTEKNKFFIQLKYETEKFSYFANELYLNRHKRRYDSLNEQLDFIKSNKEYKIFSDQLEKEYKNFYRDISTFQEFISTNIQIKQKIIEKYNKYISTIDELQHDETKDEDKNVINLLNESIENAEQKNKELLIEIEKKFSYYFYQKYNMQPIKVLKQSLENKIFTPDQAFYLGIFIGVMILLLLTIVVLSHSNNIDIDEDIEFKSVIPIYRTFGILILYLWTLGLNVWAWNRAYINYKALFAFDSHYSDVISICKRAAVFTIILFISLLTYLIVRSNIPMFSFIRKEIPIDALPLFCWLSLLTYFFIPMKIFNYPGRMYTMNLFVESVASIFVHTEFRHIWFMDQLTSLIGPMRDMEYTMCYYSYYPQNLKERVAFCGNTRGIYLFIGIFPNFIRILQCTRVIIDKKKVFPQLFNIGKYSFNIIVAVFSFMTNIYPKCFVFWLISAFISGCYSSFWDIKMDFGFFEEGPNFPLRNKLTYKNHFFYYAAIIINVLLRFLWVLSVSPEIMNQMIRPEFLALILFTLEMFRRGQWNFIRVEYEHLDLIKKYQISYYEDLPFIKVNGSFIINQNYLINILNFEKEDKIKVQLKNIFQEMKEIHNSREKEMGMNISEKLENYLEEYKDNTLDNTNGYVQSMSK